MIKKRLNCFAFIFLITITPFTPNLIISCSSIENKDKYKQTPNDELLTSDQFFPKIQKEDYYDLIEFINHKPYIGDKLKMRLIKDVVSRVASTKGKISFFIHDNQDQKIDEKSRYVKFHFKWVYNETTLFKTYTLNFYTKN